METSIIKIGNSKGLRLSKPILDKYNIKDKVDLIMKKDYIIIKASNIPRKGWENSFQKMHQEGDDILLINDVFDDEKFEDWVE